MIRSRLSVDYMKYAYNPLAQNRTPMAQMIRELYAPTDAENAEWLERKKVHDRKRQEAIARLEREGYAR